MTYSEDRVLSRPFVIAWGTYFACFVSFYVLLAALPIALSRLGGSEVQVGLLTVLFSFSSLLSRPWVGRYIDEKGPRWMILLGTMLFSAGSICFVFLASVPLYLAVRLLHGGGMAALGTGGQTLVAMLAPAHRRAETMGYWGLSSSLPMAIGPAIGLFVMDLSGFGAVAIISTATAIFAIGLAYSNPAGQAVRHGPAPPSRQWFSRAAVPTALVLTGVTVPYGVITAFLPLLAIQRSIPNLGLYFTVYAASLILSRGVTGKVADRHGRASVIVPGLLFAAAGVWAIDLAYSLPVLLLGAALYGFGFGSAQPALAALTIDRVPADGRGVAMSTFGASWELGMMLGAGMAGPVLAIGSLETLFAAGAAAPLLGLAYFLRFNWLERRVKASAAQA